VNWIKRKQNRLKGYDYSRNGVYFITICTKEKRNILGRISSAPEAVTELSAYGIIADKYLMRIRGLKNYIIMPNHIHMLISIESADDTYKSIPQIIKSFKILVTKEVGFSVFQRSYHDHIVRNESEYQKIWKYIDENPIKWQEDCYYNQRGHHEWEE